MRRKTWSEEGEEKGQRRTLQRLLEKRFGPLNPQVQQRFETLAPERLDEITDAIFDARSLRDLGLEE